MPNYAAMEDMFFALRMAYFYDSIHKLTPMVLKLERVARRLFPYTDIPKAAKYAHLRYDIGSSLELDTEVNLDRALNELKELTNSVSKG